MKPARTTHQQFKGYGPGRASLAIALLLGILITLLGWAPAASATPSGNHVRSAAPTTSAEQQLADRYAPIVVVRRQDVPCGDGEPFRPVPVTTVLGNPDVVLRGPDGAVVKVAPTAADIAGKGDGFYLDYPGSPLTPGCDYETWSKAQSATPTVYAHVLKQADKPETLVLQYWFFWVYNDWNDKHEGDWEMIQLEFPAVDAQAALTVSPTQVAYAQHEGSEVANWDDPKLHRDGDHVAVYPGQGSHAAYFTQARWFGKSAAAGFGCDNTTAPGVQLNPKVVLLPDTPPPASGEFAWLDFTGRWGEKAPSFNNGPTGPNTKTQWTTPVSWQQDEGRASAVAIPPVGGVAVDGFCTLTAAGSLLFIKVLANPWLVIIAVVAILVLVVLGIRRTRWRGGSDPLVRQRRAGQIVGSAFVWWWRKRSVYLPLGLILFASAAVAALGESYLLRPRATSNLAEVGAPASLWQVGLALLLGFLLQFCAALWIFAAGLIALADEASGIRATAASSLRTAARRPATAVVVALLYVTAALLSSTVVLLPIAAWLLSRWAVAGPVSAMAGNGIRGAFHRSSELTVGHRWRTLWVTLLFGLLGLGVASVVGTLLLLLTSWAFWVCNAIAALVAVALLMVVAAGFSLQYLDVQERQQAPTPAGPAG